MSYSIIAALAENNAIGKNNNLLYFIKSDMKRFKKLTTGHNIIMGRKTFESLPKGPLPNRKNIVISKNRTLKNKYSQYPDNKLVFVNSPEDIHNICNHNEENFIIGGESIYKYFMPLVDKMYITLIHENPEADVFFPEFNFDNWTILNKEKHSDNDPEFTYIDMKKISE